MNDLIGRTLGPYRILEQLGMGGMATVFKAYQPAMDRYVAIKVLPPHLASDAQFHARFQREARIIAHLEHRYILPVYDVGENDGIPYLVMRWTQGGTLGDLIVGGALTDQRAVEIVGQVGEALAHAHAQGIIHRDIKPANVLITREGDALLSDFGIAKMLEGTLALTAEGAWIGTPFYMAPEQVQGQPADARTDLYALGVILYEILTGRRPFVAETPLAVALMHVHNPLPPPRQLRPDLPEPLERIILRSLAKDPADRFQTAEQFVAALRSTQSSLGTGSLQAAAPATLVAAPFTEVLPADPPTGASMPGAPPASPAPAPAAEAPADQRRRRPGQRSDKFPWAVLVVAAIVLLAWRPWKREQTAGAPTAASGAPGAPSAPSAPGADVVTQLAVLGDAVWASSEGGLVRWGPDLSQEVATADDDMPFDNNQIQTVIAAPDGTLWIGGGGVARVKLDAGEADDFKLYDKDDGLGMGSVRTLIVDRDGAILAGGSASPKSVSRFDGDEWATIDIPFSPTLAGFEMNVRSMLRSQDGSLWLGLDTGTILRLEEPLGSGPVAGYNLQKERVPDKDLRIRRLVQTPDGTLWAAASDNGLLRFDRTANRWDPAAGMPAGAPISEVAQLNDGLWAAGDGLVLRSADNGATWQQIGGPADVGKDIGSVVRDGSGRIWVGAYDGGVSILEDGAWRKLQR